MTEHSEPRRWTLDWQEGPARVTGPKELDGHKSVPVREDTATEADVEAVARHLAERDHGASLTDAPICEGYKDEARSLLSTIFKEGGEGS